MRLIALPAGRRLERLATPGYNRKQVPFSLRQELVELKFITKCVPAFPHHPAPVQREASLQIPAGHLCLLATAASQGLLWARGSGLSVCLSVDPIHMMLCCEHERGGRISLGPGGRRSRQKRISGVSSGGHTPSSWLKKED